MGLPSSPAQLHATVRFIPELLSVPLRHKSTNPRGVTDIGGEDCARTRTRATPRRARASRSDAYCVCARDARSTLASAQNALRAPELTLVPSPGRCDHRCGVRKRLGTVSDASTLQANSMPVACGELRRRRLRTNKPARLTARFRRHRRQRRSLAWPERPTCESPPCSIPQRSPTATAANRTLPPYKIEPQS